MADQAKSTSSKLAGFGINSGYVEDMYVTLETIHSVDIFSRQIIGMINNWGCNGDCLTMRCLCEKSSIKCIGSRSNEQKRSNQIEPILLRNNMERLVHSNVNTSFVPCYEEEEEELQLDSNCDRVSLKIRGGMSKQMIRTIYLHHVLEEKDFLSR